MKKFNMKRIMNMAWKMAKQTAFRKGGKPVEYISATLKQAWKVAKVEYNSKFGLGGLNGNKFYLTGSNRQPMYLAVVTGKDDKYGLKRDFINTPTRGKGDYEFTLEEGNFYNWKQGEQYFGKFVNGKMIPMTKEEMLEVVA